MSSSSPVLVIGASGKTSRRVAERLEAVGVPVRRAGRKGPTRFDWSDRGGWADALAGCGAVYVVYSPDLAIERAHDDLRAFVAEAREQGVRRLVLLSGRGEPAAQRCERVVLDSGLEATVVRASWFAQNFTEGVFAPMLLKGTLALPVGERREPFIDIEDVADIAFAALTGEGHVGELYEVTGPRLMTFAEAVGEIAKATGRDLHFVSIDVPTFRSGLEQAGLDPNVIGLLTELFATTLDGRNEHVSDGVQRALGRPARDFRDHARTAAAVSPFIVRGDSIGQSA